MANSNRKIYCVGEAIYDIIIKGGKPVDGKVGGALLNTAVSLGRCGLPVEYVGDTGDDSIGELMKTFLEENHVGIKHFSAYKGSKSRLAVAFIDDANHPNYVFYKLNTPQIPKLLFPKINTDDIVIFGSFFGIKEVIRKDMVDFLKDAKAKGALILYDPNFRVNHLPILKKVKPFIEENMEIAHITKGSNDDFKLVFDTDNMEEMLAIFEDKKPDIFLYTANKHGIGYSIDGLNDHHPVIEIAPLSAIGAGDAFNAGLAYAIYNSGITAENYVDYFKENMNQILNIADDFAVDVCLSFDNYVGDEIIKNYGQIKSPGDSLDI